MKVQTISDLSQLSALQPAWDDLARHCLEPNPFFESWCLLPAWQHLGAKAEPAGIFVYGSGADLIGFIPVTGFGISRRLPLPHLAVWQHLNCFLGTPLVRADAADDFWRALLDWVDARPFPQAGLLLDGLSASGPVFAALTRALAVTGVPADILDSYTRGAVITELEPEAYLTAAISGKHRKDLRKKRRQLEGLGEFTSVRSDDPAVVARWAVGFADLEQKGWKGAAGTALAQHPEQMAFFQETLLRGAELQKVVFHGLLLNNQLVSGFFLFRTGGELFAFKIAYDEEFHRFSPGLLVGMEMVQSALTQTPKLRCDSCAAREAETIRRLFKETKTIQTLLIAKRTPWASSAVRLIGVLRQLKRRMASRSLRLSPDREA